MWIWCVQRRSYCIKIGVWCYFNWLSDCYRLKEQINFMFKGSLDHWTLSSMFLWNTVHHAASYYRKPKFSVSLLWRPQTLPVSVSSTETAGLFHWPNKVYVLVYCTCEMCVIACFHHKVDQNCALLGYYAASSGDFLLMFHDNLSVTSSRVKLIPWRWDQQVVLKHR
jgi:hypothetical protein